GQLRVLLQEFHGKEGWHFQVANENAGGVHLLQASAALRASCISRNSPRSSASSARMWRTDRASCWWTLPLRATFALPAEPNRCGRGVENIREASRDSL